MSHGCGSIMYNKLNKIANESLQIYGRYETGEFFSVLLEDVKDFTSELDKKTFIYFYLFVI